MNRGFAPLLACLLSLPLLGAADGYVPPEGIGNVHMPISCSAAAAEPFDRGLSLLHNFWYDRALHEFDRAIAADGSCAIAYWGAAMTYNHPLWSRPDSTDIAAARAYLARGARAGTASERERRYVAAVNVLYGDGDLAGTQARELRYRDEMKNIASAFPDDETLLFTALAILSAGPSTVAVHDEAAALVERVHTHQPNHPGGLHYLIHAYDIGTRYERGLPAARAYSASSPAVPHALHMPSHIFEALGMWEDSERSNAVAWKASADSVASVHGDPNVRDFHTLRYLQYARVQLGQYARARQAAQTVLDQYDANVERIGRGNLSADETEHLRALDFHAALISGSYAIESGDHSLVERLPREPNLKRTGALVALTRAFVGAATHDRAMLATAAAQAADALAAIANDKQPYFDRTRVAAHEALAIAARDAGDAARSAEHLSAALAIEGAESNRQALLTVVPAHELAARFAFDDKRYADAEAAYARALELYPRRAQSLLGATRSATAAGDATAARRYAGDFLTLWQRADANRSELAEIRTIAGSTASATNTPSPAAGQTQHGTLAPGETATLPVHAMAGGAIRFTLLEDGASLRVSLLRASGAPVDAFASVVEPKRATLTSIFPTPAEGDYTMHVRNEAITPGIYDLTLAVLTPAQYNAERRQSDDVRRRVRSFVLSPPPDKSFYERISLLRAIDSKFGSRLGERASEMDAIAWMQGTWSGRAHVFATPSTREQPYKPVHDDKYAIERNTLYDLNAEGERSPSIVFEPLAGAWYFFSHSPHPGLLRAPGWRNGRITFEGAIAIAGLSTHMRQTITKRSDRAYHLLNEEILADGRVVALDEYEYEKKP
ncbi:MAG: hypothetical protein NVS3B16_22320 [Vulcanimicrobiaceae bacterium]